MQGRARLAQLADHRGQREARVHRGAGGHDGQGQRQPGAALHYRVQHVGLRRGAGRADPFGDQVTGVGRMEQVQVERVGPVGGDQAGELIAAGHEHQAAGCAGQQRAQLFGVPRVVQHDQHAPAGDQAPVEPDLGVQGGRDAVRRHGKRVEEGSDRLGRAHDGAGRVEPAEVEVELPVGEPVGHPVRPVQGERGLSHAGRSGHRRDDHGGGNATCRRQDRVQFGELVGPAAEPARRRRQLARYRQPGCRGGRRRVRDEGGVGGEDLPVKRPQGRAGIGAQLVGQTPAHLLVVVEGIGLAAAPVEREHQLAGHPFVERVRRGQPGHVGQHRGVVTEVEGEVDAIQFARVALRVEGLADPVQPRGLQRGEGLAPPQIERPGEHGSGLGAVLGGPGVADQAAEPVQVHRHGIHGEQVAAGLTDERDL